MRVYTLALRKILLYNPLYYFLFFIAILFMFFNINSNHHPKMDTDSDTFRGVVTDIFTSDDVMKIEVKNAAGDKISATFVGSVNEKIELGDEVLLEGELEVPAGPTIPNAFNYKNYLKYKNIYYVMDVENIIKIADNHNILYAIKNRMINSISQNSSFKYLFLFVLGDNRYLDDAVREGYRKLGISHLFSVSGMHIGIFSTIILFVLKKVGIGENKRYFMTCLFILFYMFLVNFCPSVLRSGIFFILLTINKVYYFNIKSLNILILTISIILFFNPFIVYNTGFLYSSVITASLIIFGDLINRHSNYFVKIFYTSLIAFCFSLPISLYNYSEINVLSMIYNIFYVPLVSIIVFPLALICLIIPFLSSFLNIIVVVMENMTDFLNRINCNIIFIKPNLFIVFIYYFLFYIFFKFSKIKIFILIILTLFIHYNYNLLFPKTYVIMIDVGQGDSVLLHSRDDDILIDTGGKYSATDLSQKTLIPLFKSLGIKRIKYLVLTHGDFDHMGESVNLVKNFPVDNVIFNRGELNTLENDLIKTLKERKIKYYRGANKLKLDKYDLYFLNTHEYADENDNSNVLYLKYHNYQFLFMGDAGVDRERDLLEKYHLRNIDFLKVGHHGSKTSSSQEFIKRINPQYSLISVGKNNRYGHPEQATLKNLANSKIYRTDRDGSVKIDFVKNGYVIRNYI